MIRCVSYLRTSSLTNSGSDKDSQSRQEGIISAYADQHGYTIVESAYDEGRSGADPLGDREGFNALLEFCREHSITTILFETSSRYARDKDVAVKGFYMVEDFGINSLIDCEAGLDLLGMWNSGKAYEAILPFLKMIIAEDEKREVVRRLKSGRDKKKAEIGKCGGRKSLIEKFGKEIRITAVRARRRGRTFEQISRWLAQHGVTTENGSPLSRGQIWHLVNTKTLK
jgi:DNA invertase Pin-like site-specific DNA recombinase